MIAPNTNIRLLKTPMELNDANTLSFNSETDKYNYFNSLPKLSLEGATYQRKEGVLRYPTNSSDTFEDLLQYNYCMYQNASYDNKWFYAYIDDIKYINDGMTEIKLRTDTFMTWQNDIVYKQSFIERQHVSDDTIGLHTIPENLETGEYIVNSHGTDGQNGTLTTVCATTLSPGELVNFYGGIYTGIPSGISYYRFDTIMGGEGSNSLQEYLSMLTGERINAVQSIFLAPNWLVSDTSAINIPTSNIPKSFAMSIPKINNLDTYIPKNKKLLTYPYVYINMSNGQGGNAIYLQELWEDTNGLMTFNVQGCLTPGCSIRGVPYKYKGTDNPYDEGLNLGKFPQISWTTDQYTNWLTQNGVNIAINVASTLISTKLGLKSASIAESMAKTQEAKQLAQLGKATTLLNSATGIANTMEEIRQHSMIPPQAEGNLNSGDVTTASGNNKFHYYRMTIRRQQAKVIDDFFTMYGYKVNSLETINIHKRTYFDYIKTIGCNIIGNIPQKDLEEIRNLFDNGLTIWHNPSYFLDYSVNNSIL